MNRGKGLSPDEIATFLRELPENQSNGGELSCSNLDSEKDITLSESDCKKSEKSTDEIDNIPLNLDMYVVRVCAEWIPQNSNVPATLAIRNVFRQSSRTRFAKHNVKRQFFYVIKGHNIF
ncbi:hypothetical protein TNCV_1819041 [Trichonephila clavipes]|nr:hypothetical protein TNCV_1819041 [Trichonephila clavipes]